MSETAFLKQLDEYVTRKIAETLENKGVIIPRVAGSTQFGGSSAAALSALSKMTTPTASTQYRESRIIEGFNAVATYPPSGEVIITNKKATSGTSIFHRGLADGQYVELAGDIRLSLDSYLNPTDFRVIYLICDQDGMQIAYARPQNKIVCAKIVIPQYALAVSNDYSRDSYNAYIVGSDDPYFDNTAMLDDDSIAAFKNAMTKIFAENLFGSIKLSNNLEVISADGSTKLLGTGLKLYDRNDNLIAQFTKDGVQFYDTTGGLIACFGPYKNQVSAFDILSEKTLVIKDNDDTTRVKLGMLSSSPRQTWGFEMYDETGKTFMSTTRNRAWFLGAQVTARLFSVPFYSFIFGSANVSNTSNELLTSGYVITNNKTVNVFASGQTVASNIQPSENIIFDGNYIWVANHDTSANSYLNRINIADSTVNRISFNKVGYGNSAVSNFIAGMCYAKNKIWMTTIDDDKSLFKGLAIYCVDPETLEYSIAYNWGNVARATNQDYNRIIFDGQYLYTYKDRSSAGPYLEKFSFNSDWSLKRESVLNINDSNMTVTSLMVFDGSYIYIVHPNSSSGKIKKIDPVAMSVTSSTSVNGSYLTYDGRYLWFVLSTLGGNQIRKINPSDMSVLNTINLSVAAVAYYPVFDGKYINVMREGINNYEKVDIFENSVLGAGTISDSCGYACFDGLNIWTADDTNTTGNVFRNPLNY